MVKLRFVGREPLDFPVLGREVGRGELIDVDPDVYAAHEWPKAHWKVIAGAPARKRAAKKTAAKKAVAPPTEPAESSTIIEGQ